MPKIKYIVMEWLFLKCAVTAFGFRMCLMAVLVIIGSSALPWASPSKGIVRVKTTTPHEQSRELELYTGSYALIMGVSDYTDGWDDLHAVPHEIGLVEAALQKRGFHVVKVLNPTSEQMLNSFQTFINQYGYEGNARLLFFFSGHGHTRKGGTKGYLVPADAPDPAKNEKGFLAKALPMDQILSWSRQLEAKHALFLFDSCFSGTVFKAKGKPKTPPYVTRSTALPVRQYITAGDAGETVPARSVFTPAFIDALEYGWADLTQDGYVTGEELGLYLKQTVPKHSRQNPQCGTIQDYNLARGDFIFMIRDPGKGSSLLVETRPEQGNVWVNGRAYGPSPVTVTGIEPGKALVRVVKEGYETWEKSVRIQADRTQKVRALLKKTAGIISVESVPEGADWYLDGAYAGRTPDEMQNVSEGSHRVTVRKPGYGDWDTEIRVKPGERIVVTANLPAPKTRLYVETFPSDARVRIMNIRPPYEPGIALKPGSYDVKVTAHGHQSRRQWVEVTAGEEKRIRVTLSPIPVQQKTLTWKPRPGDIWKEPTTGMEFVWVPEGCFEMGQTHAEKRYLINDSGEETYHKYKRDELPRHRVCVDGFWMGKYEVSRGQFRDFVRETGYRTDAEKQGKAWVFNKETDWKWKERFGYDWKSVGYRQDDTHPVACVSWNDAKAFADWLSRKTDRKIQLPTEAQWEYAARGGVETMRFWGSDESDACRYANVADQTKYDGISFTPHFDCKDGYFFSAPVGNFRPNPFGLYDMLGNVWEWCGDWYGSDYYSRSPVKNPKGPSSGRFRVLRGGSWRNYPVGVRCAIRYRLNPDKRTSNFGFRLVAHPPQ